MTFKIISGGQTGVDRAALDVAIKLGIEHGGYCPAGRRCEDGKIPARYNLVEVVHGGYVERTRRNVLESAGTVVITAGPVPTPGSRLTLALARDNQRHWLHVRLSNDEPDRLANWLARTRPSIVNVAGSRESKARGIYVASRTYLDRAIGHYWYSINPPQMGLF